MINYKKTTEELIKTVGLRQNGNPEYPQIPSNLLFGEGKVLINHPLINIENLSETAKQFNDYEYSDYDGATTYGNRQQNAYPSRVEGSEGEVYEFVADNPTSGTDPVGDVTGTWELVNLLGLYLEDLFLNSAYEIVSEILTNKSSRYETKSLLQYNKIYQGQGRLTDKIINKGSLVGFEIVPKRNEGITTLIKQIGTHFDAAGDIEFYLFNSSQNTPVATFTLAHSTASNFQWHNKEIALDYANFDDNIDSGSSWYLLYDQNQITGQAINKNYDYYKACSFCSQYDNLAKVSRKDFYFITAIEIPASARLDDGSGNELMFDIANVREKGNTTYGLNLSIEAKCDLTEIFTESKEHFATALATKFKINFIKELAYGTRVNGIEEKTRKLASFVLQDKHVGGEGLMRDYEKQINKLDLDFSNLNTRCLPKKKEGRGIRTSTNKMYR